MCDGQTDKRMDRRMDRNASAFLLGWQYRFSGSILERKGLSSYDVIPLCSFMLTMTIRVKRNWEMNRVSIKWADMNVPC